MKYIAAHFHRIFVEEMEKMEADSMTAQQWKAKKAPAKSKDAKQQRQSKSTKYSPLGDSNDSK